MGWLFPYDTPRKSDIIDDICEDQSREGWVMKALKKSCRGNVLYVLHESGKPGETERWIGVYLLAKDDGNWGYKDMDEGMGPYAYDCPISYLDEADPPRNETAKRWREQCREKAKERSSRRPKTGEIWKLKDGCSPQFVKITSLRPLRGNWAGMVFRIRRRQLDRKHDAAINISEV